MNWSAGKKLIYDNQEWGQKDIEFNKVIQLPQLLTNIQFTIVINKPNGRNNSMNKEEIENYGWKILKPEETAGDWRSYKKFIGKSSGEFSVAKETYVKANTGWFSCRSACYLASGKPVITQDTEWSRIIPTGKGLFAFKNVNDVAVAADLLLTDPEIHSRAARNIAEEFFDSKKVLGSLIQTVI
jgi:hypothetical protein